MIKETEKISVLNYNENSVSVVVSPDRAYRFEPSEDGVIPSVIQMTIDEIRYANNCGVFKNGTLFFDSSKEADVYEDLNIPHWENILRNDDIQEIIMHPTFDGLSRLVAIKDSATFERVRSVYHKLIASGNNDISIRVAQVIQTRYRELLNGQTTTSINLTKNDIPEQVRYAEVDELKEQNAALQEQMSKMQKLIEQMMSSQSSVEAQDNVFTPSLDVAKKSSGRPKKKQG